MNVNDVNNLISNLGFPIVVSGALFWLNMKTSETYSKTIEEMRKTVEKNTTMVSSLIEKLSREG